MRAASLGRAGSAELFADHFAREIALRLVDREQAAVEGGGALAHRARLAGGTGNLRLLNLVEEVQVGFLCG